MYRKFDVTGNLLFAQYFFFEEVNTAKERKKEISQSGKLPSDVMYHVVTFCFAQMDSCKQNLEKNLEVSSFAARDIVVHAPFLIIIICLAISCLAFSCISLPVCVIWKWFLPRFIYLYLPYSPLPTVALRLVEW
jgi:hypothetical protein